MSSELFSYNLSDKQYGDKPYIVWIGGSFSPPTVAHYANAKAAIDAFIGGKLGLENSSLVVYFVPLSKDYNKASVKDDCLKSTDINKKETDSDEHRKAMLGITADDLNEEYADPDKNKNKKIFVKVADLELNWVLDGNNDKGLSRYARGAGGDVNSDISLEVLLEKIRTESPTKTIEGGILLGQDNIEQIVTGAWGDPVPFLEKN